MGHEKMGKILYSISQVLGQLRFHKIVYFVLVLFNMVLKASQPISMMQMKIERALCSFQGMCPLNTVN